MALIHEQLYRSTDLARIDMVQYIQDLALSLLSSFGKVVADVALQSDIAEVELDGDQAMPCGLIVNELVTNALKYAFADTGNGVLFIGLGMGKGAELEIVVRDNGVGLPSEFDYRQATLLGLRLVHTLVQQLRGTMEIIGGGGAEFKICFTPTTTNPSKRRGTPNENEPAF